MSAIDFVYLMTALLILCGLLTARFLRERAEADRPKSAHAADVWASAWDGTR